MFFEAYKSILYSDTQVPDIFINEYLPSMDGDCVKIYLHCLFLSKYNKFANIKELSKKLGIDVEKVKNALIYLESIGIISKKENSSSIVLNDLKEKEINKMYRLKTTSTPEEAALSQERNKKRNDIIKLIRDKFFQGVMAPSWYTDIDAWFDRYKFEEDVMYALFHYCYEKNGLTKNYISKVADHWNSKNIRNSMELDNYWMEYQKYKDMRGKIAKKLKLGRNFTEYEEEIINKWFSQYNYTFEIIELALKKTTSKANPSFNYLDGIVSDWWKNNLKTKEEIMAFDSSRSQSSPKTGSKGGNNIPQKGNFEQRSYDDDYYDNLYENIK